MQSNKRGFMSISMKSFIFLSCLIGMNLAYAHGPAVPYPYPVYPQGPHPAVQSVCPYGQSLFCHTYSGKICSLYVANYQSSWFSACINKGPFHACLNLPTVPQAFVQNTCHYISSPCVCSFGFINGMYIYEPGVVL